MRSLVPILFTAAVLCMQAWAQESTSEDVFQKSLAAYQNKQFQEARDGFQKLISEGRANANLLHNLALTEYQLDQKAMALALWRKALYLEPEFKPARAGRDLLESQGAMRPFERDSVNLWRTRWLENFSIHEILWLTALLLAVTGSLWIRYISRRRIALEDEKPMPPFPVPATLTALLLLLVIAVATLKAIEVRTQKATVIAASVNIKSLPSDSGVAVGDAGPGSELRVLQKQTGWIQVQNSDGLSGWVKGESVLITTER